MDIVKALIDAEGGIYNSAGEKKTYTPGGAFIVHNSSGEVIRENYKLRVYNFDQSGIRASGTYDGSPFKFVLFLPFALRDEFSIFPKTAFQKLFTRKKMKVSNPGASAFVKRFRISGNQDFSLLFLSEKGPTCHEIAKHNLFIKATNHDGYATVTIRLNESATSVEQLKGYLDILDAIAELIINHKLKLQAW